MRTILWLLAAIAVIGALGAGAAVMLAVQDEPLVLRATAFTPEAVERGKRILERNDPRRLRNGDVRSVTIQGQDADLALNYLLQRYARGSGRIVLQAGAAHVAMTLALPHNPLGSYLNVDATLDETPGLPRVRYLRIGRLPVPAGLADALVTRGLALAQRDDDVRLVTGMIREVHLGDGRLNVVYQWQEGLPARLQAAAVPPAEQARLRHYQVRLAQWSREQPAGGLPLTDLLRALFQLAAERAAGGDAVAENQAAILASTFYVTQQDIAALVPAARDWPRPVPRRVLLGGRDDFPKHFLVSAALASNAGKSLADAVGLYKEIEDSRGGSGFSFNDIAADGAGTRFGVLAVASPDSARRLQQRIAAGVADADIMPPFADLPEFMPEAEFVRRFGGVGAPEYRRMSAEIERRIDALPVNR